MQVNTNYNSQSFGAVKFTQDTVPLLKRMSAKELKLIKQWQKDASQTKNWDLEVHYNKYVDNFTPIYKNKNKSAEIKEHFGGIDAYKLEGNTVFAHSYTNDENIPDKLQFLTAKRANEAFEVMKGNAFKLSPFESVKRFVKSLKLLDESYEFMGKK